MRARFPQNWIFRACAPAQSSLKIGGTPAETEVNVSKKIKLFGVLLSFVLCFALLIGCNLGYDMLGVNLDTGNTGFSGDFYVSPVLSVGFRY